MKIVNCMIARGLGGVEQAFLDYNKALLMENFDVLAVTDKRAKINKFLAHAGETGKNFQIKFSQYNLCALWQLYKQLKSYQPDLVITHSKKVLFWFVILKKLLHFKLAVVAHNPKLKHLNKADFIFTITDYQKEHFIKHGFGQHNVFVVPNMYPDAVEPYQPKVSGKIIKIGTFGRFDPQKGFTDYIEALHLLQERGIEFQAVLGGDAMPQYAAEKKKILTLATHYNLNDKLSFPGWIKDKKAFFADLDIFVLSSKNEPFGIVLLEAMAYGKTIVSSRVEGPGEIFKDGAGAVLYPAGDYEALADALQDLISDEAKREAVGRAGHALLEEKYTLPKVAKVLKKHLKELEKRL